LEQDINLDREFDAARKRRHLEQQCSESRGRHNEDVQQEEVCTGRKCTAKAGVMYASYIRSQEWNI